ncbi:hypothetical protein OIU76_014130 [Salix suchowensis]|uniref:Uncharacterized protein n=1 Tax=Salix koriyanagi TaxID=2511006 RepID=A0A9Q0WLH5_9ROSI|nr:hypothetical protein OIU76_014130 [Salix suchowensis]KAJ6351355.1 hypothetical protein OIU78_007296 [Salix suchowensis]KAJ6769089.1 hypothetical protein OIU74_022700 [Salix koriyanagi]
MDDKENVDSGLNAQEEVKEFATDGKIEMLEDDEIEVDFGDPCKMTFGFYGELPAKSAADKTTVVVPLIVCSCSLEAFSNHQRGRKGLVLIASLYISDEDSLRLR